MIRKVSILIENLFNAKKIMTKFDTIKTINLGTRLQEPTRFSNTTHKNNWKSFLQDFTHESLTR